MVVVLDFKNNVFGICFFYQKGFSNAPTPQDRHHLSLWCLEAMLQNFQFFLAPDKYIFHKNALFVSECVRKYNDSDTNKASFAIFFKKEPG
jgi:hypothetical protein